MRAHESSDHAINQLPGRFIRNPMLTRIDFPAITATGFGISWNHQSDVGHDHDGSITKWLSRLTESSTADDQLLANKQQAQASPISLQDQTFGPMLNLR